MAEQPPYQGRNEPAARLRLFRSRRIRQIFAPACFAAFIFGIVMAPRIVGSSSPANVIGAGLAIGLVLSLLIAGVLKAVDLRRSQRRRQN